MLQLLNLTMLFTKLPSKRIFWSLALAGCLATGIQTFAWANSNPGLTLFSGVRDRQNLLSYYLDFGGQVNSWDRYRLRIPAKKLTNGAAKIYIVYPDYFKGRFDPDKIEVRIDGKALPLDEVIWDQENYFIEIVLTDPILANNKVEVVLSNVKNPPFGGTFYFDCQVLAAGDLPIREYLGTWILTIGR
jgi:hypothetical protein